MDEFWKMFYFEEIWHISIVFLSMKNIVDNTLIETTLSTVCEHLEIKKSEQKK